MWHFTRNSTGEVRKCRISEVPSTRWNEWSMENIQVLIVVAFVKTLRWFGHILFLHRVKCHMSPVVVFVCFRDFVRGFTDFTKRLLSWNFEAEASKTRSSAPTRTAMCGSLSPESSLAWWCGEAATYDLWLGHEAREKACFNYEWVRDWVTSDAAGWCGVWKFPHA